MTIETTIIDDVWASKKQFEDTNNHTNRSAISRTAIFHGPVRSSSRLPRSALWLLVVGPSTPCVHTARAAAGVVFVSSSG